MTWIPCACVCGEVHPHPHAQTSIGPHAAIDPAELWVMGMCVRVASVTPAAATAKNRNTVVMDTPEEAGEEDEKDPAHPGRLGARTPTAGTID